MVFRWCALIRKSMITLEANSFSKIPAVTIHDIIVGLYYQNNTTARGMGIKLAMHILCYTNSSASKNTDSSVFYTEIEAKILNTDS